MTTNVLAIIVTYYPERQLLYSLVNTLLHQVNEIIVVDNTPAHDDIVWEILVKTVSKNPKVHVIRFGKNLGIATALNTGIQIALREKYSHVLLCDQDSLPAYGMVDGLLLAETSNASSRKNIGAVGPVYQDKVTEITYPFQIQDEKKIFYSHCSVRNSSPDVECLSLITSGTLINTKVLRDVGGMREDFFIDQVDIEWSHRATSMGYKLIGTGRAVLMHNMGDECLKVWFFGWRNLHGYRPQRLYYRYRNFMILLSLPYVTLRWKIRASMYWLWVLYAHILFSSKRCQNLNAFVSGVFDGLCKKSGSQQQ